MSSLLAIGFANPLLLGALGLVAAPIIIHLIARRRFRVVEWGAMRFLLEAERENRRKARFEEWLLLLLRCLAMALLALLFARPILDPGLMSRLLGGDKLGNRIVIIDDSASMNYQTANQTEFDQSLVAAEQLLTAAANQDDGRGLAVFRLSNPDAPFLSYERFRAIDLNDAKSKLRRIEPTALRGDPGKTIEALTTTHASWLATGDNDIHIFSDFQETDWQPSDADGVSTFAALREWQSDENSPRENKIFLYPTGANPRPNVSVQNTDTTRPIVVAGFPTVIRATVANDRAEPLREAPLDLKIDDSVAPNATIEEIAPAASAQQPVEVAFPDAGLRTLTLAAPNHDQFPDDDTWQGAYTVRTAINVLIVNGAPGDTALTDEVYLLINALAPPGPLSSGVNTTVILPEDIENTPLTDADVVMLCNVPPLASSAVRELERFVAGGGGLFIALGDYSLPAAAYNAALYRDGTGLLPLPIAEPQVVPTEAEGLEIFTTAAEDWTGFLPSDAAASLGFVRVRAFAATAPEQEKPANSRRGETKILARFSNANQSPALVSTTFGDGRVVLFTSSIDADWNNWARTPDGSYVVLALETARHLARRDPLPAALAAGTTPAFNLSLADYESTVIFRPPGYPDVPQAEGQIARQDEAAGDVIRVSGPPATERGSYEIELNHRTRGKEIRRIAINLPAAESDLARVSRRAFATQLAALDYRWIEPGALGIESDANNRRELWRWLAAALLGTLLLEQFLAWRFGGGRLHLPHWLRNRLAKT